MPSVHGEDGPLLEAVPSSSRSKLAWIEGKAGLPSLSEFLAKNVPSKTYRSSAGDGYIWVSSKRASMALEQDTIDEQMYAIEQAKDAIAGLQSRFDEIDANDKIPKTKSKTSGPSKRMVKETAVAGVESQLRECGQKIPSGKWLFFEGSKFVDVVFTKLATSIIDGPLSRLENANCHTIKVATAGNPGNSSGRGRDGESQQLICLYFEDIWNKEHATEVLQCIVKEHGEIPGSAKPDLFTYIGLDSKHPSKIRSTLYRPGEIFNFDLLREWQSKWREEARKKRAVGMATKENTSKSKGAVQQEQQEPIDPKDFWPEPKDDDEDDFEKEPDTAKSSIGQNESRSNTNKSISQQSKGKDAEGSGIQEAARAKDSRTSALDDDEGSETESDDDEMPLTLRPGPLTGTTKRIREETLSPTAHKAQATGASGSNSDWRVTSTLSPPGGPAKVDVNGRVSKASPAKKLPKIGSASASPPTSKPVKSTPSVTLSRQQFRKRDRFGRDDF